jgi:hypothetical protein
VWSSTGARGSCDLPAFCGPARGEDDHGFDEEQNETRNEHSGADHRGPAEVEINVPIDEGEKNSSEEKQRACPAAEAG